MSYIHLMNYSKISMGEGVIFQQPNGGEIILLISKYDQKWTPVLWCGQIKALFLAFVQIWVPPLLKSSYPFIIFE